MLSYKIFLTTIALAFLFLSGAGCSNNIPPISEFDFEKTGNITKNNSEMDPDIWNLIFEEPGSPALSVYLNFNELSICVTNEVEEPCVPDEFEQGARARITGKNREGVVSVDKMWILE